MEFVFALVHGLGDHKLRLKHLGLDMYDSDVTDGVETLLKSCTELRSLCLEWAHRDAWSPEFLVRSLQDIGQQLVLLSLHQISLDHPDVHNGDYDGDGDHDSDRVGVLGPKCLDEICLACPNLK